MAENLILAGGITAPASPDLYETYEKVIDRALLALVVSLTPGYLTVGGVPKAKTGKQRQSEYAELRALLKMMVDDLGIRGTAGPYEEALEQALGELGVVRGVITENKTGPRWSSAREHGPWALRAVMSAERKSRVFNA